MSIKDTPWAAVSSWMVDDLKLKGTDLMVYALLFERDVRSGTDSARIDSTYVFDAAGVDGAEVFASLTKLATKDGLLEIVFSGEGGLLEGFRASIELAERRIQGGTA